MQAPDSSLVAGDYGSAKVLASVLVQSKQL